MKFGHRIKAGPFEVEYFRVAHSVPDAAGLAIHTPIGTVVHTGDFKIDHTPVDSKPTDMAALARLGTDGVHILLADSTGVERPGFSPSESTIGPVFDEIMRNAPGRVLIATFSSLIARIQQAVNYAHKYDRKVGVVGRSMTKNVEIAIKLGYLKDPGGAIQPWEKIANLPARQIAVVTTGAQGEPTSALSRMANRDHRQIQIRKGDTVVLSASPIPGNVELVSRNIDNLFKLGANVIYGPDAHVHVSGHPGREELKMLYSVTRPRYLIPVHGEVRHLIQHGLMAESLGMSPNNIFIPENGRVMEFTDSTGRFDGHIPAGNIFVDGLGVGNIGDEVLRDRRASLAGWRADCADHRRSPHRQAGQPSRDRFARIYRGLRGAHHRGGTRASVPSASTDARGRVGGTDVRAEQSPRCLAEIHPAEDQAPSDGAELRRRSVGAGSAVPA